MFWHAEKSSDLCNFLVLHLYVSWALAARRAALAGIVKTGFERHWLKELSSVSLPRTHHAKGRHGLRALPGPRSQPGMRFSVMLEPVCRRGSKLIEPRRTALGL